MFKNIRIRWHDGPRNVMAYCQKYATKYNMTEKDLEEIRYKRMLKVMDFLPDEEFPFAVVATTPAATPEERLLKLFDVVEHSKFRLSLDFIEDCKSIKELHLLLMLQAMFTLIVMNNYNVDIYLSEKTTDYLVELFADYFDKDDATMRKLIYAVLKRGLRTYKDGAKCIMSYNLDKKNELLDIELSPYQSLLSSYPGRW